MSQNIWLSLLLSAALGGFIGWITNWLAIKALFHPKQPFKLLFFEFQGLLPKRQKELAQNLGRIIEGELINIEELIRKVEPSDLDPIIEDQMRQNRSETERKVKDYIRSYLDRIPFVKISADGLVRSVMDLLEREIVHALKKQIPGLLDKSAQKASEKISVKEIVFEKVSSMDLDKLEAIFYKIADREMAMIIRLGGVLGVMVGCVQWAIQNFVIN
ncbi:MAG: hypothetical protein PWR01_2860 [Clostridiales bacterium]|nr:hypothetical protein [Clostridiales bacterium]MDN5281787.1 hypothetical protein [Candidatus Ozemobacter sp.]